MYFLLAILLVFISLPAYSVALGCEDGFNGENCTLPCGNCLNFTTCDNQTGICKDGCQDGYQGLKCVEVCENNTYGSNCSNTCGNCLGNESCNPFTGACPQGCEEGWEGYQCTDSVVKIGFNYVILGVVLGSVAAVGIIVGIITVIVCIKRKRKRRSRFISKEDDRYEPVNKETLYPRKYDEKDEEGMAYYNAESQAMYYNPEGSRKKLKSSSSVENVYEYVSEEFPGIAINNLENVIKHKNKNKLFEQEFQHIPRETGLSTATAMNPANKIKNRSTKVLPYDETRVILELLPNRPNSDYINANFIDGIDRPQAYIATQAPRKNTIDAFWRMVWQMNSTVIIMLTNLQDNRQSVCEQYWPEIGDEFQFEDITVTVMSENKYAFFNKRIINIKYTSTKETRMVKQYQFRDWLDGSFPDPTDLIMFHRSVVQNNKSNNAPMVVHCSDGAERTGTYIALDALFIQGQNVGRIDVQKFIQDMRRQRMNMVQTVDHYVFLHDALLEAFKMEGLLAQKEQKINFLKNTLERTGSVNKKKLTQEFDKLRSSLPVYGASSCLEATRSENRKKNRNSRIVPVDKYRASLKSIIQDRTDYINAVKVPSYTDSLGFLVTCFPLPSTIVDFWRMIHDYNSKIIVSLVEIDHIKESRSWWPASNGTFKCAPFTVDRDSDRMDKANIKEESITLSSQDSVDTMTIKVFEVTSWSRKYEIPPDVEILLNVIDSVREFMESEGRTPITVMSLDGSRRCGLFCAIYNILESIKIDNKADIYEIVRQLKLRRPEFIQNLNQYSFCYDTARYLTPNGQNYIVQQYA